VVSSQENFLLPDLNTRRQSQMSTGQVDLREDTDSLPLLVSYAQVHQAPSPSLDTPQKHTSPSLSSFSSNKTSPRMKRKVSFASSISMASGSSMSLSSMSKENRVSASQHDKSEHSNLLNKNSGETAKLYLNTSQNILPRLALVDVS
jgi:hypothetical protein